MITRTLAIAVSMLAMPVMALSAQTRGGLTKIELLALQQEMRDQDCGNKHAAGIWDAATRAAIRNCAKKYNTSTNAKELLAAMNIGFSPGDNPPTAGGAKPAEGDMAPRPAEPAMMRDTTTMKQDTTMMMKRDTTMMMRDTAMMKDMMKKDTMMKDMMMKKDTMMMKKDTMVKKDTIPKKDTLYKR
jgi:hypothetical protein